MMNPLPVVTADLRKNLAASLGVVMLLALAFSGTVAMSLLERGLRQAAVAGARDNDLVVGAAGSQTSLVLAAVFLQMDEPLPLTSPATLDALSRDPRVAAVSPLVFADNWEGRPIIGVGPAFPAIRPDLRLSAGRWPAADFEVVAGDGLPLRIGTSFHGAHGFTVQAGVAPELHPDFTYVVVGILAPQNSPWDRAAYTPYTGIWHMHRKLAAAGDNDEGPLGVSAILVKPKGFAEAYQLKVAWSKDSTTAAFPAEVLGKLFALVGDARQAASLVTLGFQAVVFAAVLIGLLASLPEKRRRIGLLRALGAGGGYVFMALWLQTAVVFGVAAVVGLILGWTTAAGLSAWLSVRSALFLPISLETGEFAILGLFWLAGAVGALVPALAGYRISVRQALLRE